MFQNDLTKHLYNLCQLKTYFIILMFSFETKNQIVLYPLELEDNWATWHFHQFLWLSNSASPSTFCCFLGFHKKLRYALWLPSTTGSDPIMLGLLTFSWKSLWTSSTTFDSQYHFIKRTMTKYWKGGCVLRNKKSAYSCGKPRNESSNFFYLLRLKSKLH